eukprot:9488406-Pyramimonas_sp.AAC.1
MRLSRLIWVAHASRDSAQTRQRFAQDHSQGSERTSGGEFDTCPHPAQSGDGVDDYGDYDDDADADDDDDDDDSGGGADDDVAAADDDDYDAADADDGADDDDGDDDDDDGADGGGADDDDGDADDDDVDAAAVDDDDDDDDGGDGVRHADNGDAFCFAAFGCVVLYIARVGRPRPLEPHARRGLDMH